jgi:hypothetical protein
VRHQKRGFAFSVAVFARACSIVLLTSLLASLLFFLPFMISWVFTSKMFIVLVLLVSLVAARPCPVVNGCKSEGVLRKPKPTPLIGLAPGCFTGANVHAAWVFPTISSGIYTDFGSGVVPWSLGPQKVDISLSFTGSQFSFTPLATAMWTNSSFNGMHVFFDSPSSFSFSQAVLDPNSTLVPNGPIIANATDLFINMAGVSYQ